MAASLSVSALTAVVGASTLISVRLILSFFYLYLARHGSQAPLQQSFTSQFSRF
jgi:hypothetical protein